MTTLYATDLDRTLIFSARAAGGARDLVTVERLDGRDLSFMSRHQLDLLARLRRRCLVVPVTTRTLAQYGRVHLATEPPPWAVAANGGVLVRAGRRDAGWDRRVRALLDERCAALPDVSRWLAGSAGDVIDRVRVADGLFLYALVDRARLAGAAGWVDGLAAGLEQRGWRLSVQGRKLYAVPGPLRKSAAVREVAGRAGATRVIAAGDSLLDRDLLDDAEVSMRPAHGELHELGVPADVVTAATGVAAGEELLRAALGRVPAAPGGDEGPDVPGGRVPPTT